MKTILEFTDGEYDGLMTHLLPQHTDREHAAFLFATSECTHFETRFRVIETRKLGPEHFAVQQGYYIELEDDVRAGLIKRAHDLGASLIEIHSHLGPWPAEFSVSDRQGLRDTVPHMFWRLKKRPYLALVTTKRDFDALVWITDPHVPHRLDAVIAGERALSPTNRSLGGWT
jgi:hypothetical protein